MVVILSSQINSACVTHCIVRCKGVIFCPLFRVFYILWLPFLQGLYSVSYPLFRETSTLSLCVWVRLLVYGRLQLDPFFALVVSMAHRRLQLDPAFCPGSFNGSREITTRSLSCPGPFSGSREITTRSLFALVRSAVLGRLQLDPLSRFNMQGRLQLDPFSRFNMQGRLQLDPFSRFNMQGRLQLDPFLPCA